MPEPTPVKDLPDTPEQTEEAPTSVTPTRVNPIQTVGRRKEAVARVILRPGSGDWEINDGRTVEEYFPLHRHRQVIVKAFEVTDTEGMYDVLVRVNGGGISGQADAVQLGLARALLTVDEEYREPLREHDLLTRDPRVVERKKPGQPKARKKYQFSKR